MRAIFLFGLFVLSVITSFVFGAEKAYAGSNLNQTENVSGKVLTDSLVRNLSCRKIGVNAIYAAIRDDAFDEKRNMPIRNWGFNSGGFQIAGCWALSSTQRMFSYLTRYNDLTPVNSNIQLLAALDQVRRMSPGIDDPSGSNTKEYPIREYKVLKIKEDSFVQQFSAQIRDSLYGTQTSANSLWPDMQKGYIQHLGNTDLKRNFRAEIQVNQAWHFFRFGNIGMGAGSGPRSEANNYSTLRALMGNASTKRLTLINLRVNQTNQHVVMVKSFKKDPQGNVIFKVYDSNQPSQDQEVIYKSALHQFYAPNVMGVFGGYGPLGVFIVSENERADFEKALVTYYKATCK